MPTYEYRCGHYRDFEEMQRITNPPLSRCPQCTRKVRRLISSASFQLKGSGWYITDYARAGRGKDGGRDSTASEGKSEAKSDTKPASGGSGAQSAA